MGESIKSLSVEASNMKTILLQNNNIDILLYLAKYNPNVTSKEIEEKFGKKSLDGLKGLMSFNLVKEESCNLSLTEEGIFQVEGLLTLAA
jgi:hypothetical protein